MEFCPTCGMLLKYELPHMSRPARFFCPTCPYVSQIEPKVKIKRKQRLVKKAVDPIITKDDMSNAPKTDQDSCGKGSFRSCITDNRRFAGITEAGGFDALLINLSLKNSIIVDLSWILAFAV
ncbi:hypothetical protein M8C21_003248 [Ambrosia artemisiifolia]|uniref:DNA-directed RNA polymerase II subunit RPB9-like zinc ribbon domain-containing protein n=1 Tax=Ambrosia artemisiifolia TaxID=4212 RepID=A0AAD5CJ51_AMBAR|nr:hypothetical protein M8C21_003248 [Ambrosia artemisiifolia]